MNGNSDEGTLKSTQYPYLAHELAQELHNRDDSQLGGEYKDFSILFTNIHNYTPWAERLEEEEVVALLNEYFELMVEPIFQYKGNINKYIGASIESVFGLPVLLENHAWWAVQTAIEMRQRLAEFNASHLAQNQLPICMGIGINSDRVFCGNIGSSQPMESTVIGSGANLAVSLAEASRYYGCEIVISDTAYRFCAEKIWARELGQLDFKGINKPVNIYEVIGLRSEPISQEKQLVIEHYHKGCEYYRNRKFARAMNEFGIILEELDNNDKAAALYLRRCQNFLQQPPPEQWDGIWTLSEK